MRDNTGLVERLSELRKFLGGDGYIDGSWFGETKQRHGMKIAFWWREHLVRIDEAIAALQSSEARALTAETWRPIETAPRDGTEVLLAFDSGAIEKAVWAQSNGEQAFLISRPDWSRYPDDKPTHWKPLPDPPRALSSRSRGRRKARG